MRVKRVAALGLWLFACSPAFADAPEPQPTLAPALHTYLGVQGLLAIGVHSDIAGKQYGIGGGPLIQLQLLGGKRLLLHAEGIPVVSAPQRASAFYGQATPALGVFIGAVRFALDSRARYWLGVGATIINQRTPLPNINQVASSRLAGGRYEFFAHVPLRRARFFESSIGLTPRLSGSDRFIYSDGTAPVDKVERAAEEDISVAYGIEHPRSAFLFGLRSLNFSAVFTKTGEAADRNNGAGVIVELRHYL